MYLNDKIIQIGLSFHSMVGLSVVTVTSDKLERRLYLICKNIKQVNEFILEIFPTIASQKMREGNQEFDWVVSGRLETKTLNFDSGV